MDSSELRTRFASELQAALRLESAAVVAAFAAVPRERFLGPGPWLVSGEGGYRRTPDDSPAHVYADVLIALDPQRELNNGRPYHHARWISALAPAAGEHVVHVGAGTGYYTAILAELVGPRGRVTAIELDDALAERLRRNLAPLEQVRVLQGSALAVDFGAADGIYANAGLTDPPEPWLDRLVPGGRMILPLSEMVSRRSADRAGAVLWLRRIDAARYEARFLSTDCDLRIYPCRDGRSDAAELRLAAAFASGGHAEVRSLRRDLHEPEARCWLHAERFCLSRGDPEPRVRAG
jgi:protein-L-isoaspartate(D-aspartate) O-methyltransferase